MPHLGIDNRKMTRRDNRKLTEPYLPPVHYVIDRFDAILHRV
jgi:hypothetical protein